MGLAFLTYSNVVLSDQQPRVSVSQQCAQRPRTAARADTDYSVKWYYNSRHGLLLSHSLVFVSHGHVFVSQRDVLGGSTPRHVQGLQWYYNSRHGVLWSCSLMFVSYGHVFLSHSDVLGGPGPRHVRGLQHQVVRRHAPAPSTFVSLSVSVSRSCVCVSQRCARRLRTAARARTAWSSSTASRAGTEYFCLTVRCLCLTVMCFCLTAMCSEAQDRGTCTDYSVKWYYNSTESRCKRFWYGGCGGNGNRFDSEEQCRLGCVDVTGPGESPS